MNADFYRAFEDRYRGSRDLIKSRLMVYLSFVQPLGALYPQAGIVDLGCGRGEWLELLSEVGIPATGVDLDDGMLAACRERGLNVQNGDALSYLKTLPPESQIAISGFHVAEHLAFTNLLAIVQEAHRVLKPGGLLILETPNPENLTVGSSSFYLDPTHERPIPPGLLSFLPHYFAYERVKILRLQEAQDLGKSLSVSLLNVLTGVSPDYAVVARKAGEESQTLATDQAFQLEYGLTLDQLAMSHDSQVEARTIEAAKQADAANDLTKQAHQRILSTEQRLQQLMQDVRTLREQTHTQLETLQHLKKLVLGVAGVSACLLLSILILVIVK